MVIATGAMAGDIRAPTPSVARVGAERGAREQAQARLLAGAKKLKTADGKTVGKLADGDKQIAARLERVAQQSIDLDIDYSSDGSVVLEAGLPIEAVRAAVYGADAPPEGAEDGAIAALVVDARKLRKLRPVIGLAVSAGGSRYRGPVVFSDDAKSIAGDARFAGTRTRVEAAKLDGDSLVISDGESAVAAAKRAGAPVVVLVKKLKAAANRKKNK